MADSPTNNIGMVLNYERIEATNIELEYNSKNAFIESEILFAETHVVTFSKSLFDVAVVVDIPAMFISKQLAIDTISGITDEVSVAVGRILNIEDTLVIVDSVSLEAGKKEAQDYSERDLIGTSDAVDYINATKGISDTPVVLDQLLRTVEYHREFSDTINVLEVVDVHLTKYEAQKSIDLDQITFSDFVVTNLGREVLLESVVIPTDEPVTFVTSNGLQDSSAAGDEFRSTISYNRSFSDSITVLQTDFNLATSKQEAQSLSGIDEATVSDIVSVWIASDHLLNKGALNSILIG